MANIYVDGLGDINIPDDMPLENVNSYVEGLAKKQGIQLKPFGTESGTAGIGEAFVGGAKRLLSSQLTGLQTPFTGGTEAAKSGIERQRGITERPSADFGEVGRKYEEEGLLPAAKELASQIPSALAEQAPFLAESFAGAKAGARLGAMAGAPFEGIGAIPGAIVGGALGAFAPSFIAALGGNVERQAQEQIKKGAPVDVDTLKATGAAIPQGLLDVAEQRLVFGKAIVGKMLGLSEKEIAKSTEKSLEKQLRALAEEGTISTLGKGTLRGISAEVPTEIAQQALERWQAGLPLADKDALKEYGETAYGVALLGPLGAVGRFSEKGQAREELARRDALEEFERSNPDVASVSSATPSNLDSAKVNTEATNFLSQVDREKPFDINRIVELTGDDVAHEGDATAVANELLKRGEIVQEGGTEDAPQFRFLKDEERIVPHLDESKPYLYASPVTRPTEEKTAEGYEVSNPGINVTRKAKTPEEAENIKTQMDARVGRMTEEIDNKIKDLQSTVKAIQDNLNVSIASNISDEELGARYDEADAQFKAAQEKIAALQEERGKIAQETSVTPIGEQTKPESGYEVRLYRPGQSAKTLVPFATREQAEQFILQNATPEQQQAIFEDQTPHRESLRETQKKMYMPGEAAPEVAPETTTEAAPEATGEAVEQTAPQPTPEMQQRAQAVTSRLRGVLDQMGLNNVGLNVSNRLTDMVAGKLTPIDGMYLNRIINVSLSAERGVLPTFGHETIHALREMGMFSDKEWDVLSRKAKSEWIEKYSTEERYKHLNTEEQIEEAVADAFGFWMSGEYKPTGVIRGLLNRIKLFLESVGSVFRGQGFDNAEKVFTRALAGELKGGAERKVEGAKYALPQTINVDGKERPTTNSEGRPIHPTEEGVRNFWKWFGDSKVVDAEGRPLVVYHGTTNELEGGYFKLEKSSPTARFGPGFYFSDEKETFNAFADRTGGQVIPAYLKIENPLVNPKLTKNQIEKFFGEIKDKVFPNGYDATNDHERIKNNALESKSVDALFGGLNYFSQNDWVRGLKAAGFDGVIHKAYGGKEYVALDPNQVKSAIGNTGAFSPADKRIKYAVSMEDYENLSPEGQRVMSEDFLYSPLNRMIANAPKKLDGQPAAGWRQWLKANEAQAGGSKGEIYWTGLEDWLINHGKERVSQQQIAEYLKQFDAPRDVVYESSGRPDIGVIDVTDQLPEMVDPMGDQVDAAYELIVNFQQNPLSFVLYEKKGDEPYSFSLYDFNNDFVESFQDVDSAKEYVAYEANELLGIEGNTKYSNYTLGGGDNYREIPVLLSGPAAKRISFDFYNDHFPDANVLYHLRTNDRTDINNNNVLFIEEVQSDWAQQGREQGFVLPGEEEEQKRISQEKENILNKIHELEDIESEFVDLLYQHESGELSLTQEQWNQTSDQLDEVRDKISNLNRQFEKVGESKIPYGPYVTDTGKWVELAAKRIIAMAISGGYDKVAFINPAQAHYRFPEKHDGSSTKEGFENFYGKILPNKLNSLLQKYGSKVEIVELPVIGDADKWATDGEISQQLGFVVTPELAASVRQKGFPKHALPMNKVLAQGERRSVTDAEGKQIHPTKDGIRNFWRWFGDGQLKDSQGRPRVFYHASLKDIEKFKQGTADAIFFAPNSGPMMTFINYKVTQEQMAEKKAAYGAVYPVYINAKNVFDYENPEHVDALVNQVMKGAKFSLIGAMKRAILHPYYSVKTPVEGGVEEEFFVAPEAIAEPLKFSKEGLREKMASGWWPIFETGEVIDAIKKLGFDAFHVQENFGGRFYKNVAVFSPNQIKSAVGNNGLFEPQDPRIQHALSMPKTKVINSINAASKPFNKRQDPLFATPFISPQAGIGVLNRAIQNTPTRSGFSQKIKDVGLNLGGKLHDFFQLSGLVDLYGDDMPIRPYYESIRKMMGARDVYIHESTEISEEWQRLNARSLKDGNNMATVMNRATFYRYDPSKDPGNKNQRAPKTAEEIEIQRMFDALPKPYKELYVKVRNFYRGRFEDFFKKLEDRVKASVKDPKRAQDVIEQLKKQYNYYNQIEPYFPLTRFGEYWVRYTENGQMKFEMFENAADQNSFRTKIMSNPQITDIKYGVKLSSLQGELGASDFVKSIMDSLDQAKGGFMGQAQIEDLKDSVWQLYLSNLPELSMRKQFLHRSNVPGYSNDALRAFQKNAFHGAYHMARLEFAPEAYKKLNDIRQFVSNLENTNHPDAVRLGEVFNSISSEQRQKQIWRPDDTTAPFRILGQLGFLYYLSTAASAVTNLSQNFTHTFPILGAEYGYDRATKELARSYKQFFESPSFDKFSDVTKSKSKTESLLQADKGLRSIFDITRTLEQLRNEAQTPAEKDKYTREIDAINRLYQTVISRSQAMDLAGATDRVTMSGNWFQVGMRFVAMAFHGAEVVNRTTTGLVAYRLEMEKLAKEKPGLSIDERQQMAVQRAAEIVDQAHFNYSEANRSPLFGQTGNLGKVIFMFKSYAIAETTFLFNAFRVWSRVLRARWKGTPLEQKAIDDSRKAKRMLLGVMGMQALFAGVLGLPTPLMMIVMGLANMMGGDDDDDEDKDLPSEVRFKKWLVETFGENAAQAIAYGPMSYLTGADFNSRVGLNTLWFRDPNPAEDELDQTKEYFLQLGGPIVGLGTNFVQGLVMMNQGQTERGLEKMVPNIIKAPLQAYRFGEEGATTAKGDVILDELTTPEKAMTFLGFTPFRLALEYKQQSDTRGAMFKANLEKKRILLRFNMAAKSGDSDGIDEIGEAISKYNQKYTGDPITYDTLSRSLKATAAAERETVRGLRIPKKQRGIAEGVSWLEED